LRNLVDWARSDSGSRLAVLALLCAMFIWGSTFVVTKAALQEAGPFTGTALRFLIGLGVLIPFAYRRGFRTKLAVEPTFLTPARRPYTSI